uniref:kinetochore protein KKT14 n=1 Tax=Apiculatamorpha spiralis TaxID=2795268 RepID=UPI002D21EED7|nr:Chain A, kinetochore protein KKT14 [Apiculatamorpha spiralis]8QOH_B Chain B, kinetochore protein KKT14 [Apiculatamorpha spiralis]
GSELAHFQSEIEENYEAVGNVVVDLMGGCEPTLRVGRVQLGNDIFTLREEIRATELKRVLYVGTTEGDEFPVVVYAWTNGNSYESAKAFVASQGLNVPCRIVGYRSYDKMSGYTAIIFPQGHVYSLRTFLQRSVPTRATETALYYVAETLRSLCTRRIIHCALTPDNVFMYMDSTGASLKTFPVCWDDCVDAAMFSERGLKFVPSLPVLMRHAVKEIDGSYIDFVSFCRMFRQIENNCSAMCQKVAKMKAPPVVRMTDYTNIQTELTWDMDAVMNHFC